MNWEKFLKRAEKVKELEDAYEERYFVEYRDKETGEVVNKIPQEKSPMISIRGFCTFCDRMILEPNSDDRFCKKCYAKQFPDDWKRSVERYNTEDDN